MRASAVFLAVLFLAAVSAPFFLAASAETMDFSSVLEAPSWAHPFGTDALGRDLLARILLGASVSVGVAFGAVAVSILIGTALGALAGYYGRLPDRLIMGLVDVMLCFPAFFLILSVIAVLGPSVLNIVAVIGITSWMGTARLVRAEVLTLKEREYVLASRALGASDLWIISKHLLPNAVGPVIVNAVLGLASAVLTESGLSFLGIGVQPPVPSWGNILSDGKAAGIAWWLLLFPGVAIFLTVLAANRLGEALEEMIQGRASR